MFIREKKIDCGNYREVDIIPRTDDAERAVKGKRRKRQRVSSPKQNALNEKNARRYLVQLANGNFKKGDIHLSLTYKDKYIPESPEEAEREARNFLRRVAYRRRKKGVEPLKYILVTEYNGGRVHHHIIMNSGLSRDELEGLWVKNKESIGYANADRLQPDKEGIIALCRYITKDPKGKKRWSSSRNLKRPVALPNADHKYSKRQIERVIREDRVEEYFKDRYKGYELASYKAEYYEETGWHLYMRMWKEE